MLFTVPSLAIVYLAGTPTCGSYSCTSAGNYDVGVDSYIISKPPTWDTVSETAQALYVHFVNGFFTGDELGISATDIAMYNLDVSWDANLRMLTVITVNEVATYGTILTKVWLRTSREDMKEIRWALSSRPPPSAGYCVNTGNVYELLPATTAWTEANSMCQLLENLGSKGFLAHVEGAEQQGWLNEFIAGIGTGAVTKAWLSGTDTAVDGDWRWVEGCPGEEESNAGRLFFRQGTGAIGGNYE
eukprot:Hpha_TRINITY_DN1613_c0_g1::TRINITY_DN1613_c0_g1_i1::g.48795::m.48795